MLPWPWSLLGAGAHVFRNFAEHHFHAADLSCRVGSLVPAPVAGVIVYAGWIGPRDASDGNSLGFGIVLQAGAETWLQGHGLGRYLVRAGAVVLPGQPIMLSGNTGHSGGPHDHVERWTGARWPHKGKFLDPLEGTAYAAPMRGPVAPRALRAGGGARVALPRGWYLR